MEGCASAGMLASEASKLMPPFWLGSALCALASGELAHCFCTHESAQVKSLGARALLGMGSTPCSHA